MERDILRRCRFHTSAHRYTLTVWTTDRRDSRGQTRLGYCLKQDGRPLFSGEDFAGSPLHADDSNATIGALMSFLTLRPGDTDSEYFAGYTQAQLDYCADDAEALSAEVYARFGDC